MHGTAVPEAGPACHVSQDSVFVAVQMQVFTQAPGALDLQVQVATVQLALSDFAREPALLMHFRRAQAGALQDTSLNSVWVDNFCNHGTVKNCLTMSGPIKFLQNCSYHSAQLPLRCALKSALCTL